MRILADHCVPSGILASVRDAGHAVERVVDLVDPRAPDKEVAALAARRRAVLLTADADFLNRKDFLPARFQGIIYLKDLHAAPDRVLRRLLRLLSKEDEAALRGTLTVLDRRSARVRR